jgi:hypothetical protein
MGLIVRNVGVQCDQCGAEILAGSDTDRPIYSIDEDDKDFTFCSFRCLAENQLNFTTWATVAEYLRATGLEPDTAEQKKP